MNRLMTGGRDVAWRRLAVREALRGRNLAEVRVLDVATGTGDLALALRDAGAATWSDSTSPRRCWLEAIRKEAMAAGDRRISWVEGDACRCRFPMSRSTPYGGLRIAQHAELSGGAGRDVRVLRPAGTLVCLETTPLRVPVLRAAFDWYFARSFPSSAACLAATRMPTVSAGLGGGVPGRRPLGQMMLEAGFSQVRYLRRVWGRWRCTWQASGVERASADGERRHLGPRSGHVEYLRHGSTTARRDRRWRTAQCP